MHPHLDIQNYIYLVRWDKKVSVYAAGHFQTADFSTVREGYYRLVSSQVA